MDKYFNGVKVALLYEGKLLVYLRDNKPGLRFSGLWDFFGGGREGQETPFECIKRELIEELGITLEEKQIIFKKTFPAMHDPSQTGYFMVAQLTKENVDNIEFGSEGQEYKFVEIEEFMQSEDCVPLLKPRLKSYLDTLN